MQTSLYHETWNTFKLKMLAALLSEMFTDAEMYLQMITSILFYLMLLKLSTVRYEDSADKTVEETPASSS